MSMLLTFLKIVSVANCFSSSCYDDYREISSTPYIKFDLAADEDCWDYCKYDDKCNLFSVPKKYNQTKTCSLYKENVLTVEFKKGYSSTIFGSKSCQLLPLFSNETQGTNSLESSLKDGVLVFKTNPGICLEADFEDVAFSQEYGYPLFWSGNCGDAMRWELNCTGLQGVMGGCSKATVQARNHSEYCLTFLKREDLWTATMQTCTDDGYNTKKNQNFVLKGMMNLNIRLVTRNMTRLYATLPYESPWDLTVSYTLDDFELISNEKLLDTPCRNVSVLNGQVLQNDAVPMYLPGEEMTVQCNPGYGAKFDNGSYLKVYNVTCWMFPSLVDCSPLTSELESEDSKAFTLSTGLFAMIFSACLYIFEQILLI